MDATATDLVIRSDRAGIATITLNRPKKLNALNSQVFLALRTHLDAIQSDQSVRCVVLTGAGKSFCAGHEIEALTSGEESLSPLFKPETIDALEGLAQPTIAKIRGYCLTGGLELALACDLLLASSTAQLGDTHGQWGLVPIWGMSVRLPERVGVAKAKELMFTSRRISGFEAASIGLVDRSSYDHRLDEEVEALASEIVANSAETNRIDKALLRARAERTRSEALLYERSLPFGRPTDAAERLALWKRN
jgi:enoyl-CoA hydratase/carnithine racemase